jgi:hypothetical protein
LLFYGKSIRKEKGAVKGKNKEKGKGSEGVFGEKWTKEGCSN